MSSLTETCCVHAVALNKRYVSHRCLDVESTLFIVRLLLVLSWLTGLVTSHTPDKCSYTPVH